MDAATAGCAVGSLLCGVTCSATANILGTLLIVVGVALMAGHVRILQRVKRHADVCSIFVIRSIVAAMTGAAALFARVNGVPFPLLPYRMRRRMARTARRLRVFALRDGGLRRKQNHQAQSPA